ncbi:hypothetical protein [Desulfohalovibrio reitneri]|uniref:hypothetical protein n=1 Tax=Desulfohalovibrio reitneri TaxID=1307759 RepID=UPI001F232932|nr:hypothetical protein [Desulfohalovibrio reitneri]
MGVAHLGVGEYVPQRPYLPQAKYGSSLVTPPPRPFFSSPVGMTTSSPGETMEPYSRLE